MAELLLNRNFHKVVYKRLEKYLPSFLISLSFYQTNLLLSPQSGCVGHKETVLNKQSQSSFK